MAIFTSGPMVSEVSGSIGGQTFSRNRGGQYIRARAVPTTSTTTPAQQAKAILAAQSQRWQGLTAAEKLAWEAWANTHPVTNALGFQKQLSGHQSFVQINARIDLAGDTLLDDPPVGDPPDALETLALETDIGAGDFEINFTPTPLAANEAVWVRAAVVPSAGISYVRNLLKLVLIGAGAGTSPQDIQSAVAARFGTLQVGQVVHVWVNTYNRATGLISTPLSAVSTIVTT